MIVLTVGLIFLFLTLYKVDMVVVMGSKVEVEAQPVGAMEITTLVVVVMDRVGHRGVTSTQVVVQEVMEVQVVVLAEDISSKDTEVCFYYYRSKYYCYCILFVQKITWIISLLGGGGGYGGGGRGGGGGYK